MAEPKIYSKNYVNSECTFTSTHGSTFLTRMADADRDSQYITTGANSDLTTPTIQVTFMEGGSEQTRTIDTIVLLNHNLKEFAIQWSDGAVWTTVVNETVCATPNTVWTFSPVEAVAVRIFPTKTQVANEEKEIGELIVCGTTISFSTDMTSYRPSTRQESVELKLADGTIHRTVMKSSPNRSNKYEAAVQFSYLTLTELATLRRLKESGTAFLWHPESTYQVDDIFYVHWTGGFQWQYVTTYKGSGVRIDMTLKEV